MGFKNKEDRAKYGKEWMSKKDPAYESWRKMKQRCNNKKHHKYPIYGGRGITICNEWINSFDIFLADMGPRPLGTTIDRINPDLGYYKENCRWADAKVQGNNKRK